MLKIKVTEKSGKFCEYINNGEIINKLHLMGHGLPEKEEIDENGNPTGNIIPAEYTVEIIDITAQIEQEKINAESLKYLQDTDWYIIRELDSGVPCPVEIKTLRSNARAAIVK